MTTRKALPWPAWMIALDVVGTLFLALGLIGLFGNLAPGSMNPADARLASIALIVFGALLTLPFLLTLIRQALAAGRPN